MSGGHFDYVDRYIDDIANEIEDIYNRQGQKRDKDELWNTKEYYEKYPEETFYETFSPIVQAKLLLAVRALKEAYIYARRIDYFLSGDDGEDSFIERLNEELSELNQQA